MKQLLFLILFFSFRLLLSAQAPPELVNYQAVARDGDGIVLDNQPVSFQFSILDALSTPLYVEQHNGILTNEFGLVNLRIGGGSVQSGDFGSIDWAKGSHSLKIEVDPSGGSSYVLSDEQQILSVPYALYSKKADTASVAAGLNYYEISADNEISTGNENDDNWVTMDGMEISPSAGRYFASLSAIVKNENNDNVLIAIAIDDMEIDKSRRRLEDAGNWQSAHTQMIVNVNGTEKVQGRFRSNQSGNSKQAFAEERSLILIRIGDYIE
jgi:hypothetical protein